MRPTRLEEFIGQTHLLNTDKPLYKAITLQNLHSMILWGPPGTGKTTLAKIMSHTVNADFSCISAVFAGVKDIRAAVAQAKIARTQENKSTVLFVDEVHRFNKAQQDSFLPYIEDGTFKFIGATTENPAFELNNALLSRTRVYVLKPLMSQDLVDVIKMAIADEDRGYGKLSITIALAEIETLAYAADGDARRALNLLEIAVDLAPSEDTGIRITKNVVQEVITSGQRRYDKKGDIFYDQISALHKSVRGSAPDAALYWFARMLDGGCDPLYVARRVVRMASEDVGNADPRALQIALSAWDVQSRLGQPEGDLAIAQAIVYLACAPKSNAVYSAYKQANDDMKKYGSLAVPLHLRNAPTSLSKHLEHGKNYVYPHDLPDGYVPGVCYFPDEMDDKIYYHPVTRGLEIKIKEKLAYLSQLNKKQ